MELNNLVNALGAKKPDQYPDDHFDLIWTDPAPYKDGISSTTSENCPGLDD